MANKKRTSLDALGLTTGISSKEEVENKSVVLQQTLSPIEDKAPVMNVKKASEKTETAKTTVYVPRAVFEQWRELAFTERKKMHDYLLEGLDRVFADRGLKSISELKDRE